MEARDMFKEWLNEPNHLQAHLHRYYKKFNVDCRCFNVNSKETFILKRVVVVRKPNEEKICTDGYIGTFPFKIITEKVHLVPTYFNINDELVCDERKKHVVLSSEEATELQQKGVLEKGNKTILLLDIHPFIKEMDMRFRNSLF